MIVNDDGTNIPSFIKRIDRDLALSDDGEAFLMVIDVYDHSRLNIYEIKGEESRLKYKVRELAFKDLADFISVFEDEKKIEIVTGRLGDKDNERERNNRYA